jgi:putative ABC transport system permease protein
MEKLFQNIRYSLRTLAKSPAFTVIAVLTLGIGIGINASIFSLIRGILLRQPPVSDAASVVVVVATNAALSEDRASLTAAEFLTWQEQAKSFTSMAAADDSRQLALTGQGDPRHLAISQVSANYFKLLGVSPEAGRTFTFNEGQSSDQHVVVLSHDLWQRTFRQNGNIIGKAIKLGGDFYTVVGVMPSEITQVAYPVDAWIPLALTSEQRQQEADAPRDLMVYARLKPGVTLAEAKAELKTLASRPGGNGSHSDKEWSASVLSLRDYFVGVSTRNALFMLMAAVAFVLLIACANVAGLLIARGTAREKEFAIRTALGAGRWRVIQVLLVENVLLALAGGLVGLMLAFVAVQLLRTGMDFSSYGAWYATKIRVDGDVLAFTLGASLLTVLLFGLVPALQSSAVNPNAALKEAGRTGSIGVKSRRLRSALVMGEIALALVLLTCSTLMIQGLSAIMQSDMGFSPKHVITASLALSKTRYDEPSKQVAFADAAVQRIANLPGVSSAAASTDLPASQPRTLLFRKDGEVTKPEDRPVARYFAVSPDYLRVMSIPLLDGRGLAASDTASTPAVALANQTLAQRFFPKENPIGKHLVVDLSSPSVPSTIEVVGVVGNVADYPGEPFAEPQIYMAYAQNPSLVVTLVARTAMDPTLLAAPIRQSIWSIDNEQPIDAVRSMTQVLRQAQGGNALMEQLLGIFAVATLLLAAIGIYGVIDYTVAERTREIGIRMALGARRGSILMMIFRKMIVLAASGLGIGFLLSLPLPRLLQSSFHGLVIHPSEVFIGIPLLVILVATLATCIPARRASKVDPLVSLRYE